MIPKTGTRIMGKINTLVLDYDSIIITYENDEAFYYISSKTLKKMLNKHPLTVKPIHKKVRAYI